MWYLWRVALLLLLSIAEWRSVMTGSAQSCSRMSRPTPTGQTVPQRRVPLAVALGRQCLVDVFVRFTLASATWPIRAMVGQRPKRLVPPYAALRVDCSPEALVAACRARSSSSVGLGFSYRFPMNGKLRLLNVFMKSISPGRNFFRLKSR